MRLTPCANHIAPATAYNRSLEVAPQDSRRLVLVLLGDVDRQPLGGLLVERVEGVMFFRFRRASEGEDLPLHRKHLDGKRWRPASDSFVRELGGVLRRANKKNVGPRPLVLVVQKHRLAKGTAPTYTNRLGTQTADGRLPSHGELKMDHFRPTMLPPAKSESTKTTKVALWSNHSLSTWWRKAESEVPSPDAFRAMPTK